MNDMLPLAVDLDGTLVRTDFLFETFLRTASRSPLRALYVLAKPTRERAALKEAMAELGTLNIALLPFNAECVDHVRSERLTRRQVVLISASTQVLVDAVAEEIDLFDNT